MSRLEMSLDEIYRNDELLTKVKFYFSKKEADEWYNPEEGNRNLTQVNLNPITVKMLVNSISPAKLHYKRQGTHSEEGKEIYCDKKYRKYFENASRIVIDSKDYSTHNSATGTNISILTLPKNQIRVTIFTK